MSALSLFVVDPLIFNDAVENFCVCVIEYLKEEKKNENEKKKRMLRCHKKQILLVPLLMEYISKT